MPGAATVAPIFPWKSTIGGERHGLSFLARVTALDGSASSAFGSGGGPILSLCATEISLALELGFPEEKPLMGETAWLGTHSVSGKEMPCLLACAANSRNPRRERRNLRELLRPRPKTFGCARRDSPRDLGILNPKNCPLPNGCAYAGNVMQAPVSWKIRCCTTR